MNRFLLTALLLLLCGVAGAQDTLVVNFQKPKAFATPEKACVDFLSTSPDLKFREVGGAEINELGKNSNGLYLYRAVCETGEDGQKRNFYVADKGGIEKNISLFLDPQDQVEVQVVIKHFNVTQGELVPVARENTAGLFITSNSKNLIIKTNANDAVSEPKLTPQSTFEYELFFDVSDAKKRALKRVLLFSVDGENFEEYPIDREFSPKVGLKFVVLVLKQSSFLTYKAAADQAFANGNYALAASDYKEAQKSSDKPQSVDLATQIATSEQCHKYLQNAKQLFDRGEALRKLPNRVISSSVDSVSYNHNLAKRLREAILKENSADPYCRDFDEKYAAILPQIERIVMGVVVDNMNQGKRIPGVSIYAHNGPEKKQLAITDAQGEFRLFVPGNYDSVSFYSDLDENYKKPFTQRLEHGKHYNLTIKLQPAKH